MLLWSVVPDLVVVGVVDHVVLAGEFRFDGGVGGTSNAALSASSRVMDDGSVLSWSCSIACCNCVEIGDCSGFVVVG